MMESWETQSEVSLLGLRGADEVNTKLYSFPLKHLPTVANTLA